MNLLTIWQNKFAVMVAILALLMVLAIGALALRQCAIYDDYGNCVMWEEIEDGGDDDLMDLLGS